MDIGRSWEGEETGHMWRAAGTLLNKAEESDLSRVGNVPEVGRDQVHRDICTSCCKTVSTFGARTKSWSPLHFKHNA